MGAVLGSATWPEVDTAGLLVVPVGSLEQHGPHLPLDTDTRVAVALAERLVTRRDDAWLAPALPYGASGEHQDFAGTLSVAHEGICVVVRELVRSATCTFGRVLLVNGHGGNTATLKSTVDGLRVEGRDVRLWSAAWQGDAHAGRTETSLLLALAPELVRLDAASPGETRPLPALLPRLRTEGVRAVSPNGVLGDPTGATAAEGATLLEELTGQLSAAVTEWFG